MTRPEDLALLGGGEKVAADLLEFRVDDLADYVDSVEACLSRAESALLTVRRPDEGGSGGLDDDARLALYRSLAGSADLVDTEIASLATEPFSGFVDEIHEAGARVVASFHDFHGFPGIETLQQKVDEGRGFGADVVKLAVTIRERKDLFSLAELVEQTLHEGQPISAMGMGPLGKLSRLVLATAGSCLNYGYFQTPNAPGQWSAAELRRLIDELSA